MCICCGESKERLLVVKNDYPVVKCTNCGLIYVKKLPDIKELKRFYSSDYFSRKTRDNIGYRDYLQDEAVHRLNFSLLLKEIETFKIGSNLLDVGCGYGFLLDEAKRKGWNVYGIDISEEACKYAKEVLKLNVLNCDLINTKFENNFFDVICLIGVIEHLLDPVSYLKEINRISKDDGLVLITTLNIEGVVKRLNLFEYKPPEHIFYFSKKSISNLLNKNGFLVEKVSLYWKYYSLYDLVKRLEEFFLGKFNLFSFFVKKMNFQTFLIKIQTNEMIVLAKKYVGNLRDGLNKPQIK
jgi:2-polyprenyl-3-methyl-5-hydroxy-6-metoxy-1,4-benzoquinol methylase